jgi:hypothetical protein
MFLYCTMFNFGDLLLFSKVWPPLAPMTGGTPLTITDASAVDCALAAAAAAGEASAAMTSASPSGSGAAAVASAAAAAAAAYSAAASAAAAASTEVLASQLGGCEWLAAASSILLRVCTPGLDTLVRAYSQPPQCLMRLLKSVLFLLAVF